MNWSDFDTRLRGEHLHGRAFTLTIREVTIEETHPRPGATQEAPVLYFKETDKGLVLSPTNRRFLAAAFGDDVRACVGKRVTLRAVPMQVGGRPTTPIRLSAAQQQTEPAKAAPPDGVQAGLQVAEPDESDEDEPELDDEVEVEPLPIAGPVDTGEAGGPGDPRIDEMRHELERLNLKLADAGRDPFSAPAPGSPVSDWETVVGDAYQRLQAPAPRNGGAPRPWSAVLVRAFIRKKSGAWIKGKAGDWSDARRNDAAVSPPSDGMRGGAIGLIASAVSAKADTQHDIDQKRHSVLRYCLGFDESARLSAQECQAVIDLWKSAEGWDPNAYAASEAAAVLAAWLQSQGQASLPL